MTDANEAKPRAHGLAALALTLALIAGCASVPPAPTEQVAVAKAAVSDAVSAGGADFAPAALTSAQAKLDQANAAMATRAYDDARRYAEDAEVDARLAAATARSRKAQRAVAEIESGIRALREEIARASVP